MSFFVSKMSEIYHLHKVNGTFSGFFLIDSKKSKKSDSIQNMPPNEYFMKKHTFLMYWGRKGPKKGEKNLKTKGTPF